MCWVAKYVPLPGVEGLVATDPRMAAALEVVALPALKAAQQLAPIDEGDYWEGLKVKTGLYQGRAVARIMATDFKSNWIEFGTVKMAAQAVLRRACDAANLRLTSPGRRR